MEEATMSGTEDDVPPLGQPLPQQTPTHHQRRHLRYATPEASTPPPPHFILEAAMSSQQSRSLPPPNLHRNPRAMSASPPPLPPIITSPTRANHHNNPPPLPQVDGQDHDRMETDQEDEDSESGAEADTPEAGSSEGGAVAADTASPRTHENAQSPVDDEVMDTSPDNPTADEHPPTPQQTSIGNLTNETTGESTALHLVHVQMPANDVDVVQVVEAVNAAGQANTSEERDARLRAAERELAALGDMRRADRARQERRREGRDERHAEDEGERDDDDSEDSEEEEEHPYWANLKEDTSSPDERELKIIEENMVEISALDYEHWESKAFEALDDSEYVPNEGHHITWTVTGVHGTPENPNREKIMRSPSKLIDGYYWNIKYYPHGNDGTEQLSIYIECSPTPWEELEAAAKKTEASKESFTADDGPSIVVNTEAGGPSTTTQPTPAADGPASSISVDDPPSASDENMESAPTPPKKNNLKDGEPWGIAAQIGCVIYNPDEPRVNASQKGCHRYYNDNPDWGWTRFHGPWEEIHKRQRYQRQALLRNDTLAFTAYIRTIEDDTKALWWHPPKDKSEWDCLAMTGARALTCHHSSAMIAAVSSWLHLSPIVDSIRAMHIPDSVWEAKERQKPAFEELQNIIEADEHFPSTDEPELYLSDLLSILNFYGAGVDSKSDVVMIWEALRRVLNLEASGLNNVVESHSPYTSMLDDILVLKQPDPFDNDKSSVKFQPTPRIALELAHVSEPHSVQEMINMASLDTSRAFRLWRSFAGENTQLLVKGPPVLMIELHRQSYSTDSRKWKKLTHRIEMNEEIYFSVDEYALYGMVVHSGDLESNEYYSVTRPEGPGTRWIKYGGDNCSRKVEILTKKKAVQAHEGSGDDTDGTTAVAYIAMYVRKDMLPSVLCTPLKHKRAHRTSINESQVIVIPEADVATECENPEESMLEPMPVYIYSSRLFQGYTGRGICEPWAEHHRAEWVKEFKYASKTTLEEIRQSLMGEGEGLGHNVRLWPMNTLAPTRKAYPELLSSDVNKSESLEELVNRTGGSRFWLAPVEADSPVTESKPFSSILSAELIADFNREIARRADILEETRTLSPMRNSSSSEGFEAAINQLHRAMNNGDDTEMRQAVEAMQRNVQRGNVHDERTLAAAQDHTGAVLLHRSEARRTELKVAKTIYFFLKIFETESQTLHGVCGHVAKSEAKVVEEVKKLLKVDAQESWDLFRERGLDIRPKDQVKHSATFETEFDGADGGIIIAQRHPTTAQVAALEAEGKCTNPIDYFHYLHSHDDPTYFQSHVTSSCFGHPYSSCSLSMGRPHGHGTLITLDGDAYTGNFTAGDKAGQGTMAYANGDTYTGEWKANEPNGHGQMVYAKTGNVYTGGFKKRKRHGKGHMVFEVADEEMHLCKICYEGEMDALFYDCGHVVACVECARQLEQCPVCRKNVRAVVRIWRT